MLDLTTRYVAGFWTLYQIAHSVRESGNTSSTLSISTGVPQGCVLSPLLCAVLTYVCMPSFLNKLMTSQCWVSSMATTRQHAALKYIKVLQPPLGSQHLEKPTKQLWTFSNKVRTFTLPIDVGKKKLLRGTQSSSSLALP